MTRHKMSFTVAILLAVAMIHASDGNCEASSDAKQAPVSIGKWGGTHVEMEVTEQGASLDFDCARGAISEPLLLDAAGKFQVKGTFYPQHGGPIKKDEPLRSIAVVYSGAVQGDSMELEFTIAEDNGSPQKFTLVRGKNGNLRRCA
jgi:hypothetical protein